MAKLPHHDARGLQNGDSVKPLRQVASLQVPAIDVMTFSDLLVPRRVPPMAPRAPHHAVPGMNYSRPQHTFTSQPLVRGNGLRHGLGLSLNVGTCAHGSRIARPLHEKSGASPVGHRVSRARWSQSMLTPQRRVSRILTVSSSRQQCATLRRTDIQVVPERNVSSQQPNRSQAPSPIKLLGPWGGGAKNSVLAQNHIIESWRDQDNPNSRA